MIDCLKYSSEWYLLYKSSRIARQFNRLKSYMNDDYVYTTDTGADCAPAFDTNSTAFVQTSACCAARCSWRSRSSASFCPTSRAPDWMPEWYTRSSESTSSMDWVRTSASSLILAVASLISSSVNSSPSCSTRDLTAFQPVKRCPMDT